MGIFLAWIAGRPSGISVSLWGLSEPAERDGQQDYEPQQVPVAGADTLQHGGSWSW